MDGTRTESINKNQRVIKKEKCCACDNNACCCIEDKFYCNKHYLRVKNHGSTDRKERKRTNTYIFEKDIVVIKTIKNESILVDKEDFENVKKWSWCVNKQGYAVANIKNKVVKINWLLFPKEKGKVHDHINGNRLDNRKCNLRLCTTFENSLNHGKQKNTPFVCVGVSQTYNGKYRVRIMIKGKEIRIGTFEDLQTAILERKKAEQRYFNEFARKE